MTNPKITVITLHRAQMGEYYVGAVSGELTDEQKLEFTKKFQLGVDGDASDT